MRRGGRIILAMLTALSLALFLLIWVLWIRSAVGIVDSYPVLTDDNTLVYPMSHNNQLQVMVIHGWRDPVPKRYHGGLNGFGDWGKYGPQTPKPGQPGRQPRSWHYLMASVNGWSGDVPGWQVTPGRKVIEYTMPGWSLIIDYWVPALLTGLLPGIVAFRFGRRWIGERRRRAVGLCAICGYDLRASTGRCPECGTNIY